MSSTEKLSSPGARPVKRLPWRVPRKDNRALGLELNTCRHCDSNPFTGMRPLRIELYMMLEAEMSLLTYKTIR